MSDIAKFCQRGTKICDLSNESGEDPVKVT